MTDINQVLKTLRENYLNELPERLQAMESLILGLEENNNHEDYQELYRHVHSQKGSAGTHGFHIISSICHQFESQLAVYQNDLQSITRDVVNHWLTYMDLIKEALRQIEKNEQEFSLIKEKLQSLAEENQDKQNFSCLLVDYKTSTTTMIADLLKEHGFDVVIMHDGYDVLGRLLIEKFDLLICGQEIASLNGLVLISANRLSGSINNHIPSVLITSSDIEKPCKDTGPDYVLKRNPDLVNNVQDICNRITA